MSDPKRPQSRKTRRADSDDVARVDRAKKQPAAGAKKRNAKRRRAATSGAFSPSALLLVPLVLLLIAGSFLLHNNTADPASIAPVNAQSTLKITEAMSKNRSALMDDRSVYSDWFELTNEGSVPLDVTGYQVFGAKSRAVGFTFPRHTLSPGETVLVFASGVLENVYGYVYHAPFRLSAQGDSLTLTNRDGAVIDEITIPPLESNESYALNAQTGAFERTMLYTPGMKNTATNHQQLSAAAGSVSGSLVITELMPKNISHAPTSSGVYDYIELSNLGSSPINLSGFMLSDNESRPDKFILPDHTLNPGEVFLVYASGLMTSNDNEVHAPFSLSADGETVLLSDDNKRLVDRVTYPPMAADRAYSRLSDGSFTADYPATPGFANAQAGIVETERALSSRNKVGLFLNEAMASARKQNSANAESDWVELRNATGSAINLEGFGLSDDPSQPRKWQFPKGAQISAGDYLVVSLSGLNRSNVQKNNFHTSFKLSFTRGETMSLSTPDGQIIDRLPVLSQRSAVSYGRLTDQNGYFYFPASTKGKPNGGVTATGQSSPVAFSVPGGWKDNPVTLQLSATPGAVIRYTLDATEPTEISPVYEAPISITETTIVRARTYTNGLLPSLTYTHSYLYGTRHSLPVVSLVSDPSYIFSEDRGIYSVGPKKLKYPYRGANFWKNWERAANVELYSPDGNTVLSQGAGVSLQGQYSRMQNQKAFKLTARNAYGPSRFDAKLFPNRDYTSYRSFILRASGQDSDKTRFRDALLTSLADKTPVSYQDTAPVIVYLNGEYWGHYNMRERIHKYSIAQWAGYTNVDNIDIIKSNSTVKQGTNADYAQFLTWLKKNGCTTEANLAKVAEMVDIDNYLDYVALEMYIGNTDLLNVKRYRSPEDDYRWRWILYDTDWAFYTDTNSYRRWLDKDGAGSGKKTDNTLFLQLMKNPEIKKKFLMRFGELMNISWRTEQVNEKINAWVNILEPEMARHTARWGGSVKVWKNRVSSFKNYNKDRPKKMLGYIQKDLGFNNSQMRVYFGDIMDHLGM